MKTKIENEKEFTAAIDQYGEALAAIEIRKSEATVLKKMLEAYADANGIQRHATDRFELKMEKAKPSLRVQKDLKEADVLAELQNSETGRAYVVSTYDAEGLKRDYGRNADGRRQLEAWGLFLCKSVAHAKVEPRQLA